MICAFSECHATNCLLSRQTHKTNAKPVHDPWLLFLLPTPAQIKAKTQTCAKVKEKQKQRADSVGVFKLECSNLTRMYSSVDMISIRLSYFIFKEMNHANKFRELLFKYQQVRFRLAILSQIKKENGTACWTDLYDVNQLCFLLYDLNMMQVWREGDIWWVDSRL